MNQMSNQDTSMGTAALLLSITGVVPLLGFFTSVLGAVFGVLHLKRYYKDSEGVYGGEKRAIAAVIITVLYGAIWVWALIMYPETVIGS